MPDFSIPATALASAPEDERRLLRWIQEAVLEGDAVLADEPIYKEIDKLITYVMGDQLDPRRSKDLSRIVDNKLKDITLKTIAGLTDIHPLFGFKSFNPNFQTQSDTLDKLARSWWVNTFADIKLADVVRYSAVAGTGYAEVVWDQSLGGGAGDINLIPRDPRDVVPIRPTLGTMSVQNWQGVILRSSKSINELRQRYGDRAKDIKASRGGTFIDRTWARAKRMAWILGPSTADMSPIPRDAVNRIPTVDLLQIYVKDYSLYKGSEPKLMGEQGTSWAYTVYPVGYPKPDGKPATEQDARLYPRGRLIIAVSDQKILWDGPNPYWHGMFPVVRLQLDPWPWSLLGGSLIKDLSPIQDAINEALNGIFDNVKKALRPGVIADKKSVPESLWQKIDTRLPGLKIKQNPVAGKGIEFTEPPNLPAYVFNTLEYAVAEIEKLSGVLNLEALTQLNQAPGADTIEQMQEALSPILRMKGRYLEGFLREMGEMVKTNFFQFYTMPRRIAMLGEQGIDFADFDYDPGTLVPAMHPTDDGYDPGLDIERDRTDRALTHVKNFTFQITPNSLLAISQISRKLTYLQLQRMGLMDRWSLWEVMGIQNGGQPPNNETTITDRLMAEQMMFAPPPVNPVGRKATAQAPPSIHAKPDETGAPRVTVAESGH